MRNCLTWGGLIILMTACSTTPSRDNLPDFSHQDAVLTKKKVNCASKKPMDCLVCALQGEAADQSAQGIYAVGVTIMTRAQGNPEKICRVTKARRQFEGMRRRGRRKISHKVWGVAEHIMESKETGWTHFWAPKAQARLKRRKPRWAYRFEKRQCTKEKIDDHIFFNTNQCKIEAKIRKISSSKKTRKKSLKFQAQSSPEVVNKKIKAQVKPKADEYQVLSLPGFEEKPESIKSKSGS